MAGKSFRIIPAHFNDYELNEKYTFTTPEAAFLTLHDSKSQAWPR